MCIEIKPGHHEDFGREMTRLFHMESGDFMGRGLRIFLNKLGLCVNEQLCPTFPPDDVTDAEQQQNAQLRQTWRDVLRCLYTIRDNLDESIVGMDHLSGTWLQFGRAPIITFRMSM